MFLTKVVWKIRTDIVCSINFSPENRAVYEIMCKKMVQPDRPQMLIKDKGKVDPLQAWTGPEVSRNLRFPNFMTKAQDGGRLSALRTGHL